METAHVKSSFGIHEVVVLSGFSKHMLDYLRRDNIFGPSKGPREGRGRKREYTFEDVVLLRALHGICEGKGRIRHLRAALAAFRAEFGPLRPGQRVTQHLVVQGDQLCVRTNAGLRELRNGQMTLGFVVDLAAVTAELSKCVDVTADGSFRLQADVARKAEEVRRTAWAATRARRVLVRAA
jgi:hypothetical protein